jgi:DNA replication protein DnaC
MTPPTTTDHPPEKITSQLAYLTRVLKTPTIGRIWEELATQARDQNWSHEEYLAAVLERQCADRESAGTTMRIRTAHFPTIKTLEDFNLDHLPSLRRDVLAHLATATFVAKAENVVLLGPPGIGKTHIAIGLGVKAAYAGNSVLFDTASNWIARLGAAHHAGQLETELKKIRRYKLIIIDEVGYIPFDQDAANLFFQLVASRYEQGSIMVTSNLPFGRWGETFSDDVVAAAMIDRLVHHAEVHPHRRLLPHPPTPRPTPHHRQLNPARGVNPNPTPGGQSKDVVDKRVCGRGGWAGDLDRGTVGDRV